MIPTPLPERVPPVTNSGSSSIHVRRLRPIRPIGMPEYVSAGLRSRLARRASRFPPNRSRSARRPRSHLATAAVPKLAAPHTARAPTATPPSSTAWSASHAWESATNRVSRSGSRSSSPRLGTSTMLQPLPRLGLGRRLGAVVLALVLPSFPLPLRLPRQEGVQFPLGHLSQVPGRQFLGDPAHFV